MFLNKEDVLSDRNLPDKIVQRLRKHGIWAVCGSLKQDICYCYSGGGKQQKIWQQQAVFSNRWHSHVFTHTSEGSSGTKKNETQDFFRYSCY